MNEFIANLIVHQIETENFKTAVGLAARYGFNLAPIFEYRDQIKTKKQQSWIQKSQQQKQDFYNRQQRFRKD